MKGGSSVLLAVLVAACGGEDSAKSPVPVPGAEGVVKSSASSRAERRLFDGAPPVIPHGEFGAECVSCHATGGMAVDGVGFSPPSPHGMERMRGDMARCVQCHVRSSADAGEFVGNAFVGLAQDLGRGRRLNVLAPPVIPHQVALRENCRACHTGPAAREEVRCSHPERARCVQCHAEVVESGVFERP